LQKVTTNISILLLYYLILYQLWTCQQRLNMALVLQLIALFIDSSRRIIIPLN